MNISAASKAAGLPVKTVRYYADIGLVSAPSRSDTGYRTYDDASVRKLIFIRRSRAFGFTIEECRELLDLYQDQDRTSAEVKRKEGFIDWAWSSEPLIKSGIFYRGRQEIIPLPASSLAAKQDMLIDNRTGILHPKGIWLGEEEVREMSIFSELPDKTRMTVSLLLYPDDAPGKWDRDLEEPTEHDTYDQFVIGGQA